MLTLSVVELQRGKKFGRRWALAVRSHGVVVALHGVVRNAKGELVSGVYWDKQDIEAACLAISHTAKKRILADVEVTLNGGRANAKS